MNDTPSEESEDIMIRVKPIKKILKYVLAPTSLLSSKKTSLRAIFEREI
jgi:hypothetical protein